jgi:hypothetical protein
VIPTQPGKDYRQELVLSSEVDASGSEAEPSEHGGLRVATEGFCLVNLESHTSKDVLVIMWSHNGDRDRSKILSVGPGMASAQHLSSSAFAAVKFEIRWRSSIQGSVWQSTGPRACGGRQIRRSSYGFPDTSQAKLAGEAMRISKAEQTFRRLTMYAWVYRYSVRAAFAGVRYLLARRNVLRHLSKRHLRRLLSGFVISVLVSTALHMASESLLRPPGPCAQSTITTSDRRATGQTITVTPQSQTDFP